MLHKTAGYLLVFEYLPSYEQQFTTSLNEAPQPEQGRWILDLPQRDGILYIKAGNFKMPDIRGLGFRV